MNALKAAIHLLPSVLTLSTCTLLKGVPLYRVKVLSFWDAERSQVKTDLPDEYLFRVKCRWIVVCV